jgi:hypothetical protein
MLGNWTLLGSEVLADAPLRRKDLPAISCLHGPQHVQRSPPRVSQGFGSRAHVFYSAHFVDTPEEAQNEPEAQQTKRGTECAERKKLHHAYLSIEWMKW